MIVNALYSCSVKITLAIWWENVILDMEIKPLLLPYTSFEKPYGPPMTKTRSLAPASSFFPIAPAHSTDEYSLPCSSSRITSSVSLRFFRIISPSFVLTCSLLSDDAFLMSGISLTVNGTKWLSLAE